VAFLNLLVWNAVFLTRAAGIPQIAIHSALRQAEIRGDLRHGLPLVIELINTLRLGQSHRVYRARSLLVGRLLNPLGRRGRGGVRGNRCSRKRTGYRNTHKRLPFLLHGQRSASFTKT
jgi:hypothetical protein